MRVFLKQTTLDVGELGVGEKLFLHVVELFVKREKLVRFLNLLIRGVLTLSLILLDDLDRAETLYLWCRLLICKLFF